MFEELHILLCRDDGRTINPGEDGCQANTSILTSPDTGAMGLVVNAQFMPDKPLFKIQHGFARQGAVKVRLPAKNTRYMTVYQHKDWWIRPTFTVNAAQIPPRTQLLLWQEADEYHALIALCGSDYRADIQGEDEGLLVTLSSNQDGRMDCQTPALAYAHNADPFLACENAVLFGLEMVGCGKARVSKRYPQIFEKLGFCTWDAFYHQVDAQGIDQKLDELREKGLPLGWVLIDDGWSDADHKKAELQDLDAVSEKFPGGLKNTITHIKKTYGVEYIGVWQALMGYWNGVKKNSPAYEALRDSLTVLPDGRQVPDPKNSFAFWHTWHSHLEKQGVDFVKIDEQSAPALFFGGRMTYGEASRGMQAGIGASTALHFDGNAIHCMGMAPEDMWARPSAALIRSSDDFVPGAPDGFLEHCKQNVYSALLFGSLYWGDFDMFWSAHEKAVQHAMLRAVSGGPVYISDKVNQTDASILWPLISGDGTVYRCEGVGLPTVDCLLSDQVESEAPLKIWNTYQDSFVIAAFSPREHQPSHGVMRLSDIPKATGEAYVCVSFAGNWAKVLPKDGGVPFEIAGGKSAVFQLIPLHEKCTVLGLTDKYVSPATVERLLYQENGCQVFLKESGTFAFYMKNKPDRITSDAGELSPVSLGGDLWSVSVPGRTLTIHW